jgi:hypothetical protein
MRHQALALVMVIWSGPIIRATLTNWCNMTGTASRSGSEASGTTGSCTGAAQGCRSGVEADGRGA